MRGMRALLTAWRRDRRGGVAVEFALLATVFFGLVGAILGTALMYFTQAALEKSVRDAARLIRTGQAQGQSLTVSAVKTKICAGINNLYSCSANLYVSVQVASSFANADTTLPVTNGVLNTSPGFDMGNAGDIVVLRAYLPWTPFLNPYGYANVRLSNGDTLLGASAVFKNEPYS